MLDDCHGVLCRITIVEKFDTSCLYFCLRGGLIIVLLLDKYKIIDDEYTTTMVACNLLKKTTPVL